MLRGQHVEQGFAFSLYLSSMGKNVLNKTILFRIRLFTILKRTGVRSFLTFSERRIGI